jgi:pimeloyl-ACP methyl ester carboxylesterase
VTRGTVGAVRAVGAVGAFLAAAALLAGCSLGPGVPRPEGGPASTLPVPTSSVAKGAEPASDPAFARFYAQRPAWAGCGEGLQCTKVTVPVDWQHPDGATLGLAVVRRPAQDAGARVGSLLVNPGGPGVSGVAHVRESAEPATSPELRAAFDLVGFDPRGVAGSEPVECLSDAELDDFLALDADVEDPGGLERLRRLAADFAAGCAADAGALLAHVDTVSAARDMDVLRAAVGDERLSYLGGSYGTLLGATYADLFPQRVGRMVLDGAIDPSLSRADFIVGQAAGVERALRAYVEDCLARRGCPLRGDVDDALAQVRSVIDAADARPLRTDDPDRPLTAPLAFVGVVAPLYSETTWPVLDDALTGGLAGDGTALLAVADLYAQRDRDGSYRGNLLEVLNAVDCLDYPVEDSPEAMAATRARLVDAAPTVGDLFAYGEVLCGQWPVPPARRPAPLRAAGAPPVLVVGTTGDPATPYPWAQALADQLDAARLLTYDGEGHTAYRRGSRCVDAAVDAYLLEGVLPGEGATC